jgi:DNA-binding transcriptional LysR family regulator
MRLLDLRLLRSFVTVGEERHVGRAARRLNIAQPPLSRRLQQLERELGVALFDRRRRRLQLTPAGVVFLQEARDVLDHADRAVEAMRGAARGETGRLRIGFVESATASGILPDALARLRRERPGVNHDLRELPSLAQVNALRRDEIDAGLIESRSADTRGLALRTILPGRCIAAVGRTHPLARLRRLTLRRIAREEVILRRREINPALYDATLAAFRAAGAEPRVLQHVEQLQTVVSLAAAGAGIGLVPDSYAAVRLDAVVYRSTSDLRIPMDLELVWRKDAVSPVLAHFLAALDQTVPRRRRRPRNRGA